MLLNIFYYSFKTKYIIYNFINIYNLYNIFIFLLL